ncbi:MAG: uroporphyrinogen-III synthase [Dokdonella sp.]
MKVLRSPPLKFPLASANVIITRPADAAISLRRKVEALGGRALGLPGLSLRQPSDLQQAAGKLLADASAQDWIFSSPAAVRFAFRLVPPLRLPRGARVFGIGAGTQRALARRGIRAIVPSDRIDSEGLLQLPELTHVRDRHIALIGAADGRGLIASTLRERGAHVESIHVYERGPPRLNRRHFDALARASDPLITLISSAEALVNLVALLPPPLLARLRHQILIVSSARLAAVAEEQGFKDVRMAVSASADDLLDAACKALARHRL